MKPVIGYIPPDFISWCCIGLKTYSLKGNSSSSVLYNQSDGLNNAQPTPSSITLSAPLVNTISHTGYTVCECVESMVHCQIYGPADSPHLREQWGDGNREKSAGRKVGMGRVW